MEGVLGPGRGIRLAPKTLGIAFILGKAQLRCSLTGENVGAELRMRGTNGAMVLAEIRLRLPLLPRPGVAEPERREQVQAGSFWTAIVDRDPDKEVVRALLGVL